MSMRVSRLNVWSTMLEQIASGVNAVPEIPVTIPMVSYRHRLPISTVRKVLGEIEEAGLITVDNVPSPKTLRVTQFGKKVLEVLIVSEFFTDSIQKQHDRKIAQRYRLTRLGES